MFDIRYQHALHTTSFQEQPVSKKSLTNFRAVVYRYNQEHGVYLIQKEIEAQAKAFSKLLKIDGYTINSGAINIHLKYFSLESFSQIESSCPNLYVLMVVALFFAFGILSLSSFYFE